MKPQIAMPALLVALALSGPAAQTANAADSATIVTAQVDVLDKPARSSDLAAKRLLLSVARAGDRLVAAGIRGHIVVSEDEGQTWRQASVPVSSDLTSIYFPSATHGWAVGHDGVVLASIDGGDTWVKQLDGRMVNDLLLQDMKVRAAADPESTRAQGYLAEAERYQEQGPDKPFLDVWFEDENSGFVVGAYGMLLATRDGGKTWESWWYRAENPRLMNLYAIRPAAGDLYVAGEGGVVLKLDREEGWFDSVPVDYIGSMFGIVDTGSAVLVFGLKGHAFRSETAGADWQAVDTGLGGTIVSGARLGSGAVLLADQVGRLVVSSDGGKTFSPLQVPRTVPLTSVIDAGEGRLAVTGPFGVVVVSPGSGAPQAAVSQASN